MGYPKPSEESEPNTLSHCWVTLLAIACLRMTHQFLLLVSVSGFRDA